MKTNIKHDRDFYVSRALKDFTHLVEYFCLTRPQYQSYYRVDGKFQLKKLVHQMNFLNKWNKRSKTFKREYAKTYAEYSRNFNLSFCIDSRLIEKVLGCYRDENDRQIRISIDDVVPTLVKNGFLKVVKHGTKTRKGSDGKYQVKCYWKNKYLMANVKQWFKLMNDKRYSKIETFPNVSDRLIKIVMNYNSYFKKVEVVKKEIQQKNKEPVKQVINKQVQLNPATFETIKYVYENGGMNETYFKWYAKEIFKKSDDELKGIVPLEHQIEEITNTHWKMLHRRLYLTISAMNVSDDLRNKIIREAR